LNLLLELHGFQLLEHV